MISLDLIILGKKSIILSKLNEKELKHIYKEEKEKLSKISTIINPNGGIKNLRALVSTLDLRIIKKHIKNLGHEDLIEKAEKGIIKKNIPPTPAEIIKYWYEKKDEKKEVLHLIDIALISHQDATRSC